MHKSGLFCVVRNESTRTRVGLKSVSCLRLEQSLSETRTTKNQWIWKSDHRLLGLLLTSNKQSKKKARHDEFLSEHNYQKIVIFSSFWQIAFQTMISRIILLFRLLGVEYPFPVSPDTCWAWPSSKERCWRGWWTPLPTSTPMFGSWKGSGKPLTSP